MAPGILAPLTLVMLLGVSGCGQAGAAQAAGDDSAAAATDPNTVGPSTAPRLDPNLIPKFVNEFQRLPKYIPRVVRDSRGNVLRREFDVEIAKAFQQQLPPPLPQTLLFTYGGLSVDAFGRNAAFRRTSPGPTFEQIRNTVAQITFRNQLAGQHVLAVDPTINWANPNNFPAPHPPVLPFPPGDPPAPAPHPPSPSSTTPKPSTR